MTKVRTRSNRATASVNVRGITVKDEGLALGLAKVLNIVGANATVTKDGDEFTITITGGAGSSAWGGITGTLSAQTDLQAELDTKFEKSATNDLLATTTIILGSVGVGLEWRIDLDANGILLQGGPALNGIRIAQNGDVYFNFGSAASGDMWYRSSGGVATRIAAGALGTVLTMGASSVPAWAAASSGSRTLLHKNNVTASLTSSTSETILDSKLVTGGTIAANDILEIVVQAKKSGSNGSLTVRVRVNTSAAVGGTVIATLTASASFFYHKLKRHMAFKNSVAAQDIFPTTTSIASDETSIGTVLEALTLNFAIDQYIIVTLQQGGVGTDTSSLSWWYVEQIRS